MKNYASALAVFFFIVPLARAQTEAIQKEVDEKLKSLRADDAELKRILANHPDVLVAKAKVQLANEELSKIERNLTIKYLSLIKGIEFAKQGYNQLNRIHDQMAKSGAARSTVEMNQLNIQINRFAENLLKQEAELDEVTYFSQLKLQKNQEEKDANSSGLITKQAKKELLIEPGSPADKLKSIIDKPVEYSCKEKPASEVLKEMNGKMGDNVIIRMNESQLEKKITSSGKFAISTWIELVLDDCNSEMTQLNSSPDGKKYVLDAYVRDYGILITYTSKRPQDAMTLREFTALVRAEKAKTEPKK